MSQTFTKQPSEIITQSVLFRDLPPGRKIASGTVSSVNLATLASSTSTFIGNGTAVTVSGSEARYTVIDGTDGQSHKVTLKITLDDGTLLEEDLIWNVVEQ